MIYFNWMKTFKKKLNKNKIYLQFKKPHLLKRATKVREMGIVKAIKSNKVKAAPIAKLRLTFKRINRRVNPCNKKKEFQLK